MLKRCLLGIGVIATLLMAFDRDSGEWQHIAALLFMIANIAIASSFVFYDSLLPHIAAPDEMDRVSTAGYAMGYLGGGILLVINLLWILTPQPCSGLPSVDVGDQALVRQRRGLVAAVLDPVVPSRARAAARAL